MLYVTDCSLWVNVCMRGQHVVVSAGALCSPGGSGCLVICYIPRLLCHSGRVGPCWPTRSIHKVHFSGSFVLCPWGVMHHFRLWETFYEGRPCCMNTWNIRGENKSCIFFIVISLLMAVDQGHSVKCHLYFSALVDCFKIIFCFIYVICQNAFIILFVVTQALRFPNAVCLASCCQSQLS